MDSNNHANARIDHALEALARPEPPADHVARVLARTASTTAPGLWPAGRLGLRWVLPVAMTVGALFGATWIAERRAMSLPEALPVVRGGDRQGLTERWGTPREVDVPVLPPQAYWGMDAFVEWQRLGRRIPATSEHRLPKNGSRAPERGVAQAPRTAWAPIPSGLPPIELEPIGAEPVQVPGLTPLEDIRLAQVPLAAIEIAPLHAQETP